MYGYIDRNDLTFPFQSFPYFPSCPTDLVQEEELTSNYLIRIFGINQDFITISISRVFCFFFFFSYIADSDQDSSGLLVCLCKHTLCIFFSHYDIKLRISVSIYIGGFPPVFCSVFKEAFVDIQEISLVILGFLSLFYFPSLVPLLHQSVFVPCHQATLVSNFIPNDSAPCEMHN